MGDTPLNLLGGRRLARNAVLNLVGFAAPIPVAIAAIPLLLTGLGTERFAFLTVGWVVIGYFSLFDLGLGRALTKAVAERLGSAREAEISALAWTALLLMVLLASVGSILLALISPWLVADALKVSAELQGESLLALYLLSFSLPWVITTAALRGLLEASQRFGIVNGLRIPMGLFSYLGPLVVLPFSQRLESVIAVLVLGRVVAFVAHLVVCWRSIPSLRGGIRINPGLVGDLMRTGGWMTVSSVVSPLMTYVDRFLIGALISMTAVAYYVTPYELVSKLLLVPSALVGVLFPAMATSYVHNREQSARLFTRAVRVVFLIMFPSSLIIVVFAHEGLTLWLGSEFAAESAIILQWLAIGVFVNSLAYIPTTSLHGIGRPDITAKLHLAELPLYIALIWIVGGVWGLEGIAVAWVIRVAVDAVFLFIAAARFLPSAVEDLRTLGQMVAMALVVLGIATFEAEPLAKLVCLIGFLSVFAFVGWFRILTPAERGLVRG